MKQAVVLPVLALVLGTHGFVPTSISSSLLQPKVTSGSSPKLTLSGGPQSKPVMTKQASLQMTSGFGSSPLGSGFLHSPSSTFFSAKKTQQDLSSNHDDGNDVTKSETEHLKNEVEKLESKTKQQKAMIKNLQDMQKNLLADKTGSKTEIEQLTAKVEEKEATISFLRESLNASSAECERKQRESLAITSLLDKCEKELKAANKKYELVDGCPSTFTNEKKSDICFGIIKKMSNFKDAEADCNKTYSGRLAVLDTKDKLESVRDSLTLGKVHQSVWVGGKQHEYDFKWVDGSTISRDFGWAPGEPNDDLEQCVDLHFRLNFKMNDEKCDTYIGYVCEVPK